jgi:taurine dioxygenase
VSPPSTAPQGLSSVSTRKLHPCFGLEINEFDVRALDGRQVDSIRRLLAQHGFLAITRQSLTDDDLVLFGATVGNGNLERSARTISHARDCPYVSYLTNLMDEHGHPLGFAGNDTDFWHSDQEFRESPATLAALYCEMPATSGGSTSFASTELGHLGVTETEADRLSALWSTRRPAATHDNVKHVEVAHPVVLRSPTTDARFLYHSENTLRFLGLPEMESQRLKSELLQAILAADNIYSHSWRRGDLVLYDNTQLLHRREAFMGDRWLKATKIFAPPDLFAVPPGEVVGPEGSALSR